jgi:hypothetical protein
LLWFPLFRGLFCLQYGFDIAITICTSNILNGSSLLIRQQFLLTGKFDTVFFKFSLHVPGSVWAYRLLFMIGEYRMNFVHQTAVFIMPSYQIISRLHGKLELFSYYFIITDLKKQAIVQQRSLLVDLILVYRVLSKSADNCRKFFGIFYLRFCVCARFIAHNSSKITISQRHCTKNWRTEFYRNRARNV